MQALLVQLHGLYDPFKPIVYDSSIVIFLMRTLRLSDMKSLAQYRDLGKERLI